MRHGSGRDSERFPLKQNVHARGRLLKLERKYGKCSGEREKERLTEELQKKDLEKESLLEKERERERELREKTSELERVRQERERDKKALDVEREQRELERKRELDRQELEHHRRSTAQRTAPLAQMPAPARLPYIPMPPPPSDIPIPVPAPAPVASGSMPPQVYPRRAASSDSPASGTATLTSLSAVGSDFGVSTFQTEKDRDRDRDRRQLSVIPEDPSVRSNSRNSQHASPSAEVPSWVTNPPINFLAQSKMRQEDPRFEAWRHSTSDVVRQLPRFLKESLC